MKYLFCDSCNDIVPETEAKDPFDTGTVIHVYTETRNVYGNQPRGVIGYCPQDHTIYCGKVREPTDQEYFIYYTLGHSKRKPRTTK